MRLKQKHNIKLICMDSFSKFIDIKNYELSYSMFSLPINGNDILATAKSQNKAFMKVNFFVKSVLDYSIAYTVDDAIRMKQVFGEADNNFITLPDFAETTLLEAIHSKLSMLCGDATFIDQISLKDLETEVGYDLIPEPKPEYNLPDIDEWVSEYSFYAIPWWMRYDLSTYDDEAADDKDLEKFRAALAANAVNELSIIDGEVNSLFSENGEALPVEKAELIDLAEVKKKGKWEPKIV